MSHKSNLTSYDKRFIATLIFMHFGLTLLGISLFGLHYYNREVRWEAHLQENESQARDYYKTKQKSTLQIYT